MSSTNSSPTPLAREKHIRYFLYNLDVIPSSLSSIDSTRLTIAFFAISGLDILNALNELSDSRKTEICSWIYSLQMLPNDIEGENKDRGGFQGSSTLIYVENGRRTSMAGYSFGHLAMTYTALASLVILGDDLSAVDHKACVRALRALQQPDGSFCATLAGSESCMRFVYCAACICYMLNDWSGMDIDSTVMYITNSMSYDYGIGQGPDLESHGGITYCAVATLSLMDRLHNAFTPTQLEGLKRWCIMRQVAGFQGRPNKQEDTCYSFWVGATLKLLGMLEMVDLSKNREFVMTTQSPHTGGFSKWADTLADPMHTYLGLGGLSLMAEEGLLEMNPALNITCRAVAHLLSLRTS